MMNVTHKALTVGDGVGAGVGAGDGSYFTHRINQ